MCYDRPGIVAYETGLNSLTNMTKLVRCLGLRAVGVAACIALAATVAAAPASASVLRVCADPNNMPFSNQAGEGFENKLAELIAGKLDAELEYSWFSETTGYVPDTMGSDACNLVMGYAQGTGLIDDTNPYYHTSFVLLYREDGETFRGVDRLSDPRLKGKSIGYFARTLPASILAIHGLAGDAKPFEARAYESPGAAARAMLDEVASGTLDAGILWGPVGGYYAQRAAVPIKFTPMVNETAGPRTVYGITLGVRPNDPQWKHKINKLLAENQGAINVILLGYNVPVLDAKGNLITAAAQR